MVNGSSPIFVATRDRIGLFTLVARSFRKAATRLWSGLTAELRSCASVAQRLPRSRYPCRALADLAPERVKVRS